MKHPSALLAKLTSLHQTAIVKPQRFQRFTSGTKSYKLTEINKETRCRST
jgi:hypothetical protein